RHSRIAKAVSWYLMAGIRGSWAKPSVAWPLLPLISGYAHAPNLPGGRHPRTGRSELADRLRPHFVEPGRRVLPPRVAGGHRRRGVGPRGRGRAAAVRLRFPARAVARAGGARARRARERHSPARLRRRLRAGGGAPDTPGGAVDRHRRPPDELRDRRALLRGRPGGRWPALGLGA